MENEIIDEVKQMSQQELKDIVMNAHRYRGALSNAAKNELVNRGVELSAQELQVIEDNKLKRQQNAIKEQQSSSSFDSLKANWKQNIVTDINAPELYSRLVINVFSIFFSVLFGGILLAINLKTIKKPGALPVLLYSFTFTLLLGLIFSVVPITIPGLTIAFNAAGAVLLYNFFWKKYIGKDFQYRTKPFWIPLIIGILLIVILLWVNIAATGV